MQCLELCFCSTWFFKTHQILILNSWPHSCSAGAPRIFVFLVVFLDVNKQAYSKTFQQFGVNNVKKQVVNEKCHTTPVDSDHNTFYLHGFFPYLYCNMKHSVYILFHGSFGLVFFFSHRHYNLEDISFLLMHNCNHCF